jgi:hypothetical protein
MERIKAAILMSLLFLTSCVWLPTTAKKDPYKESCELFTKQLVLNYNNPITKTLTRLPGGQCQGDACLGELIIIAAIPVGTAIVSGSIVVVGNTIHWLEYQGRCDESFVSQVKTAFIEMYQKKMGK